MAALKLVSPSTYVVVNALGTPFMTFSDVDLARAFARRKAPDFGPMDVLKVTLTEERERVYRAKPKAESPSAQARADAEQRAAA